MFSANEIDIEVAWFSPQSEYRPTEYLQAWVRFWFDDAKRLEAAKAFQQVRLEFIAKQWLNNRQLSDAGFQVDAHVLLDALASSRQQIEDAIDNTALLTEEARLTKHLFKLAVNAVSYGEFTRAKRGGGTDPANRFLDHGNYLAYGLGATATWVLGLPHGLAILHGNHLGARGEEIPAGTMILSGGVTEAVAVTAGDHVSLHIQSLGSTSVRFV